jgi:hypothetical protein
VKELDALKFVADFCIKHMPLDHAERWNEAYDLLRRAAVDAMARRARKEEEATERIEKLP